jgi:hypothetical protein
LDTEVLGEEKEVKKKVVQEFLRLRRLRRKMFTKIRGRTKELQNDQKTRKGNEES